MATKDSIMKQSIFFWVFGHRLSFEYGLKKFLFSAWRNLSGVLRELILSCKDVISTCKRMRHSRTIGGISSVQWRKAGRS